MTQRIAPESPCLGGDLRFLVVEDVETIRKITTQQLLSLGAGQVAAASGRLRVHHWFKSRPDG